MFDDIRPFNDDEVSSVLADLVHDKELLGAIKTFRFGHWPKALRALTSPLISMYLRWELRGVSDIASVQAVVSRYMERAIEATTDGFTVSGIENIPNGKAYLFMGNHRDIALDPAFMGFALKSSGRPTCRVAIGDNLLSRAYVANLMRLNKCFIVKRSAKGPKAILAAYKNLSLYIQKSVEDDGENVWIAQREGRAKDGDDKTDAAILKMIYMGVKKSGRSFEEHLQTLSLVPVSISYEYDPCDEMKARELLALKREGAYEKAQDEDIASIALGIKGAKGRVHVSFGEPVSEGLATPQEAASALDRGIIANYVLHSSNCIAYEKLYGVAPKVPCDTAAQMYRASDYQEAIKCFEQRLAPMAADVQEVVLQGYAQPVVNRLALIAGEL